MNKFMLRLRFDDLVFRLKHWGKRRPKSPMEVYNTIITFGFGIENYHYRNGEFKRKASK